MSNNLPTLRNTWELNENIVAATSVTTLDSYQKSLWYLKEALIGFSTNPWTVVSSSDSVSAGVSDLWDGYEDLIWDDTGNAHSWIVLQHPTRNTQLCLNCNHAGTSGRHTSMYVSFGGNYTGGSTINQPTADDQVDAFDEEEWLGPMTSAFDSWVHSWQSDDGARTRVLISTSFGAGTGGYYLFDEIDTPAPLWGQKEVALITAHKSVSGEHVLDLSKLMEVNKNQYSSTGHPNNFITTTNRIGLLAGPQNDTSISHFSKGSTFFNAKSTAEDEYAEIGDVLKFDRTDPFSISCWIRSTESTTTSTGIVNKTNVSSPNRGYSLETDSAAGTIIWKIVNTVSTNVNAIETDVGWMDGLWHHLVATWDGDVAGDATGLNLYIDGSLAATSIINNTLTGTIDTTEPLRISSIGASATTGFIGNIDDVAIYDKELSSAEVATLYNSGDPPDLSMVGPTANLVGYWLMGDGDTFPTITDNSINSNNATCTNMESEDIGYGDTPGNPLIYLRVGNHLATSDTGVAAFLSERAVAAVPNELDSTFPIIPDISISGNDGTATNMEGSDITVDTPDGYSTNSMVFDGVNEYVTIGDVLELDFDRDDPFTLMAWIKFSAGGTILSKMQTGATTSPGYRIYTSTGSIVFDIRFNASASVNQLAIQSNKTLGDNQWHHIALVYDGSSVAANQTMIFDGEIATFSTLSDTLSTNFTPQTGAFEIGARSNQPAYFNGKIDEMGIYDKALSLSEMRTIYNSSTVPFSDKCITFDGTSDFILVGDIVPLKFEGTDAFSFSAWFRTVSTLSKSIIGKRNLASPQRGYIFYTNNGGQVTIQIANTIATNYIGVNTDAAFNDGFWHHAVLTYDGSESASGVTIYVDGVAEATTTTADTLSATIDNTVPFQIGAMDSALTYDGSIDDVGVYNKELTSDEVTTIYNGGMPNDLTINGPDGYLVGYWRMGDDAVYPIIQDDSVNDRDAFSKKCLLFDGSEYVNIGDVTELKFDHTDEFSVSGWFRTSITTGQGILASKMLATNGKGWLISPVGSGTIQVLLRATDIGPNQISVQTTSAVFNDGDWHHIAVTWDGTVSQDVANLHIYVDNVDEPLTVATNNLTATFDSTASFQIGKRDLPASPLYFNGNIDDVAVYDKSLTSGEVSTIYNTGVPNDLTINGPDGYLVGYWLMGDGATYPTITDDSINSNDGTMTSMEAEDILGTKSDGVMVTMTADDIVDSTPFVGAGSTVDLLTTGPDGYLVGYWQMGEGISPAFPMFPISLYGDYGYYGHFGFLDDLWWGSDVLDDPTGSTFPSSLSARQFAQAGDIIHPWTGDSTTPLFGGATAIINEVYDAHFIDTSDSGGLLVVKYYQMVGIDTGAPTQPTYHSWVVSGTPDPTGAQTTPPFGPLTNIVISAEWVD